MSRLSAADDSPFWRGERAKRDDGTARQEKTHGLDWSSEKSHSGAPRGPRLQLPSTAARFRGGSFDTHSREIYSYVSSLRKPSTYGVQHEESVAVMGNL